jgi:hypothetical protein
MGTLEIAGASGVSVPRALAMASPVVGAPRMAPTRNKESSCRDITASSQGTLARRTYLFE